jgi:hypothetical protein
MSNKNSAAGGPNGQNQPPTIADQAAAIKALQPKEQPADREDALGVHPSTIDRDAAKAAGRGKNISKNNGGGAAKAAMSGQEAAKLAQRAAGCSSENKDHDGPYF